MRNIGKIIVPVDFHQHSDDLAKFAVMVANKLDGRLMFLHVLDQFSQVSAYTEDYPGVVNIAMDELQAQAQKKMAALIQECGPSCPGCEGVVLKGEVVDCIVEYVRDHGVDLIIMGTHGSKGIKKILLGSVAERVVKRASCPILIFNPYKGGYSINASETEPPA